MQINQHYQAKHKPIPVVFLHYILVLCLMVFGSISSHAKTPSIMVLGDSISASYGIQINQGWVNLLQQYVSDQHSALDYQVINASISGETTGGALIRLPKLLKTHQPDIVIIELGGNDGLRGFPIGTIRKNLNQLVSLSQSAGAKILLAGMRIPPNYGARYTTQFYESFGLAAKEYGTALVPFILDEVAQYTSLMQSDGIHPTAEAQPIILKNVLPALKDLL